MANSSTNSLKLNSSKDLMETLTQRALEFDKITTILRQFTLSPAGAACVDALTPISDADTIAAWLAEVSELKDIRGVHGRPPLAGGPDLRPLLDQARVEGAILAPLELRQIYKTLCTSRATREFLEELDAEVYPLMTDKSARLTIFRALETAIREAIDEEGEVLDSASAELKRLRKDLRQARDKIQTRLQSILQRQDYQKAIQDQVIMMRGNRYVIPFKASSRGQVKGIVHDQSSSGMTVFIEPLETVELNNRISSLDAEEKEEIRRILEALTARVRAQLPAIRDTVALLGELDFINAKTRLSEQWQCSSPQLNQGRRIRLRRARHPLLLRQYENDPDAVVPIDVCLDGDKTAVVLTGPNTGGKTVSLKTVGLLALMAQAGLHIPAQVDSEIRIFDAIYADIGDQQSIEQNLSTFSSHISHIAEILKHADAHSLVLLDELGAGTDPAEGASLGIAILEYLDQVQATSMATTHHDALKSYAYTHPRTVNACVEFDVNTLSPTYHLLWGLPGKSNAYIIAERLGLPAALIERARMLMGDDLNKVNHLIQKLTTDSEELEKKKAEAETRVRGAVRLEQETDKLLAQAEEERQDILNNALKEAQEIVDQAIRRSQDVLTKLPSLRKAEGKTLLKTLHRESTAVRQRAKDIRQQQQTVPTGAPVEVSPGQQVRLNNVGQTGKVLNLSKDGAQAELQVGALRIEMPVQQLTPLESGPAPAETPKVSVSSAVAAEEDAPVVHPELVLVGQRVDEAMEAVDKYLDQAIRSGFSTVTIVHGMGTGALKKAVSRLLREHPHVTDYALAERNAGATEVHLKRSA